MQLALRPSVIASVAAMSAGLVVITPTPTPLPDIQIRSSDVQLASAADVTATTLGGLIDAGLVQVQSYLDEGVVGLGYLAYGLLTELSTGLDGIGATALGADVLTLADDAIDTQFTTAPIADLFNELEALVNALGLNSIPLGGTATTDAAASLAADATTLGGLIDAGLTQLESSVDQGVVELGYVAYGLLTELSTGLDGIGATALGADVLTLANDAIDTQFTTAPIAELFNGLETLVADLGFNSIPLGAADGASAVATDLAPNLAELVSTLF
jgi:hypothetical protein